MLPTQNPVYRKAKSSKKRVMIEPRIDPICSWHIFWDQQPEPLLLYLQSRLNEEYLEFWDRMTMMRTFRHFHAQLFGQHEQRFPDRVR